MKSLSLSLAVACTLISTAYSPSSEAGSAQSSIQVTATVEPACTVLTNSSLQFGDYTASNLVGSDVDSTVTLQTTCTAGASFFLELDDGMFALTNGCPATPSRRMTNMLPDSSGYVGTDWLPYNIYLDAAHTIPVGCNASNKVFFSGFGSTSISLYGQIPAGAQVTPAPYRDYVVATITF